MTNITLLIVDDCHDSNQLVKFVLERDTDWKIITALNGEQGITKARLHQPSVILLDVAMPNLDGFDVYKLLKSDPATRAIPVIFTTAMVGVEERVRRRISREVRVISKPFNIRLLQAQITEQISAIARLPLTIRQLD